MDEIRGKRDGSITIPYVLEKTSSGERSFDIFSRIMEDRIILLGNEVNEDSMNVAIGEMLYLNSVSPTKPIQLFIMSPGGDVQAGLALIDVMNYISAPVYTYAIGRACSMGATILSAGAKGHRYALANAQIMVHQIASGAEGKVHDMVVGTNYDKRLNNIVMAMIAKNCGRISEAEYAKAYVAYNMMSDDVEETVVDLDSKIKKKLLAFKEETDRDCWLMPLAAKKFGIIDEIIIKEEARE